MVRGMEVEKGSSRARDGTMRKSVKILHRDSHTSHIHAAGKIIECPPRLLANGNRCIELSSLSVAGKMKSQQHPTKSEIAL